MVYRDLGQQSGKIIIIREVLLVRIRAGVKAGLLDWWLTSIVFSGSLRSEYSICLENIGTIFANIGKSHSHLNLITPYK